MQKNCLYCGDNLTVLREHIKDESVDLIYLDPPFNSRQDYNVLFAEKDGTRSSSQIMAFEDTWEWNMDAEAAFEEIVERGGRVSDAMRAFRTFLGHSDMMVYLATMTPRLIELHRVLKETGSIYLHCDPTSRHYLKMLVDAIFGAPNFRNEISWKLSDAHSDAKQRARHLPVAFTTSSSTTAKGRRFAQLYTPLPDETQEKWYRHVEEGTGRRYNKARLAADLRDLPREEFKTRLKSELLEGRKTMSTVADPIMAVHTIATPRLTFKDAAKAIEFYKQAFGAKETMRFEVGGSIAHAEITIGDSSIKLSEEWPEGGRFSAETLGLSPVQLGLQVADVDSFAARAVAAGLKMILPIKDQFYGRREGSFVDPFGYTWNISTVKEQMSVEVMHRRMKGLTTGPEGGQLPAQKGGKPAMNPIPPGYRTITPYLIAQDGPALMEFAKQAFGAEETFRTVGSAGGLHGEVRIGDSMLMMGGGIPGREFRATPNTHALHIYVEDADAVCEKAVAAGATWIEEPRDQEYGERSGSVKDPAGNYWYIATHRGESYIPKGLNDVNVYMHPLRAEPVISFLKRAFGAREIAKYASSDGVVHHAEIRVGDSVVEMGESHGKYPPMPTMFYMYVPDCDAMYRRALAAGATSLSEPTDMPYGDRTASVKDVFGNTWYIATHIKNVEP